MGMFGWLGIIRKSERIPQKLPACIIDYLFTILFVFSLRKPVVLCKCFLHNIGNNWKSKVDGYNVNASIL